MSTGPDWWECGCIRPSPCLCFRLVLVCSLRSGLRWKYNLLWVEQLPPAAAEFGSQDVEKDFLPPCYSRCGLYEACFPGSLEGNCWPGVQSKSIIPVKEKTGEPSGEKHSWQCLCHPSGSPGQRLPVGGVSWWVEVIFSLDPRPAWCSMKERGGLWRPWPPLDSWGRPCRSWHWRLPADYVPQSWAVSAFWKGVVPIMPLCLLQWTGSSASPGSLLEMWNLEPPGDILHQGLKFNTISR